MILPYRFTYLIGATLTLVPWLILFLIRKDLRKEMYFMSCFGAIVSFLTGYLWWTVDWWRPATLFGTRVGIEDLILGFGNGGVAAVIYEVLFRKRLVLLRRKNNTINIIIGTILIPVVTMVLLFYFAHLSSFSASTIALLATGTYLALVRHDLLGQAFAAGILTMSIMLPVYWILEWLSPGWIRATWTGNLTGIRAAGIPIEDFIFYFLFGFVVGPMYELWQHKRLKKYGR